MSNLGLTIIEPAPVRALTTIERYRALTGDDTTDETALTIRIEAASRRLESLCGVVFARERVAERFALADPAIWLTRLPVLTIHAVRETADLATTPLADAGLARVTLVSPQTGEMALTGVGLGYGLPWFWRALALESGGGGYAYDYLDTHSYRAAPANVARLVIEVEYTGGFILPGWPGDPAPAPTVPADLDEAVIDLTRHHLASAGRDPTVVSERLGESSWTYATPGRWANSSGVTWPASVEAVIARYRHVAI